MRWGLDVLDDERGLELQEHRGGQNICTLVCIHWLGTPRHEGKWNALCWSWTIQRLSHFTLITITTLGSVSATTTPGSCAGHCVHLTNVFSWPGPRPVVVAVSYSLAQLAKLKRALSVMDTHHILITDKENVHQPIRTIILRQCLLLVVVDSILSLILKLRHYHSICCISPPLTMQSWAETRVCAASSSVGAG